MKYLKKAQLSLEYISLVMVGIIFALITLSAFLIVMNETKSDKEYEQLRQYGFQIQEELILASEVQEGYSREITIPEKVGQSDFNISNTDRRLILTYEDLTIPYPIPSTNGTLVKGTNMIRKVGGLVVIE